MKKICHVTCLHPVYDVRIFLKECRSLAQNGWETNLVVSGTIDEVIGDVRIHGLPKSTGSIINRIKNTYNTYKKAKSVNADIYHFHDPELIPFMLILKLYGKKIIYDVHEDLPRDILSKKWIYKPLRKIVATISEQVEDFAAKCFDAVVTATPHINTRFQKHAKLAVNVNNFPILNELSNQKVKAEKLNQFIFAGLISNERGLQEMVSAFSFIDSELILAGKFNSEKERKTALNNIGWLKVKELGQLNRSELSLEFSKSLAGIVLFYPEPNHIDALPNKMFEYMSAGLPVIASNFPMWKNLIEDNNFGICVNPNNVGELVTALNWIKNNPETAQIMGENGRNAVETKFNWDNEEIKLINLYNSL